MKFAPTCLFVVLTATHGRSQTFVNLGTNDISSSSTGLSDAHPSVSGSALGSSVTFDLTITATSVTTPSLTVSNHPQGIGVAGGSPVEIDNRNNLDQKDCLQTLSPVEEQRQHHDEPHRKSVPVPPFPSP